jgi:serine/threonine protein phosphatase PrpC
VGYFVPTDPQQLALKGAIYLVADGMGGHSAGEVASEAAVELAIGHYYSDTKNDVATSLVRAFEEANRQIYEQAQADPSKSGMGTTLVAAVLVGRKVYLANVGDSRAYLVNDRGITQITEDHSWVAEQMRAGLLTKKEARRHPQRNVVTRALASRPSVEVDLFEGEMTEGDMLLLCSDGLTGLVEDKEIAALMTENAPKAAAQLLVDQANARGGTDNITVLIVSARPQVQVIDEPTTVVTPLPPRPSPIVPIMSGVAIVMVLALALAAVLTRDRWLPLLPGSASTDTPPAATATLPVPTDESRVVTATSDVVTPGASPVPPTELPTATLIPADEPTVAPTSTPAPPTETTVPPTVTTMPPTDTPVTTTVTPTLTTETPMPTTAIPETPTSTPSPTPALPAPDLVAPEDGGEPLHGEVTFRWNYTKSLETGQRFRVYIWPQGDPSNFSRSRRILGKRWKMDLRDIQVIQEGGPGQYRWRVVVENKDQMTISALADPWGFEYILPPD